MTTFFWELCSDASCVREWVFFCLDIGVFCFTLLSIVNTYRMYGQVRFELLPLSINCMATFLILLLQLFEKGFQYYLATFLVEIYTYFLFCYTFTVMYARSRSEGQLGAIKKWANGIFAIVTLAILVLTAVVFSTALSATCEKAYEIAFYLLFAFEIVLYGLTMWCGRLILLRMKEAERERLNLMKPSESFEESNAFATGDRYYTERKKQIGLILVTYTLTITLRIIWIVLNVVYSDDISCTLVQQAYIINSDTTLGNFILAINSLIDLLPHILLPIALYVIPAPRVTLKDSTMDLTDGSYENMDDKIEEHDDGRNVRKKLSLLMESTARE